MVEDQVVGEVIVVPAVLGAVAQVAGIGQPAQRIVGVGPVLGVDG
jgi:hypothetical protein